MRFFLNNNNWLKKTKKTWVIYFPNLVISPVALIVPHLRWLRHHTAIIFVTLIDPVRLWTGCPLSKPTFAWLVLCLRCCGIYSVMGHWVAQINRTSKGPRFWSRLEHKEHFGEFFPSHKCCADSLSVCPTPVSSVHARTRTKDEINVPIALSAFRDNRTRMITYAR